VLPVGYCHDVFTLPTGVADIALYNNAASAARREQHAAQNETAAMFAEARHA
jgi:hypothetical protein